MLALDSGSVGIDLQYQFHDSAGERSARRRKRLIGRLQNVCPHTIDMDLVKDDAGNPALSHQSAFETRFGTFDWRCMRCGLQLSKHAVEIGLRRLGRAFEHDPLGTAKAVAQADAKADKLIAKINRLGGAP